jgi:hypothetical protein
MTAMRLFGLVLLLCVAVDFANPLLPGAVRLDDGGTVHGTGTARVRLVARPLREPAREPRAIAPEPAAVGTMPAATEPLVLRRDGVPRRPIRPSEHPEPPLDDH